MPGWGWGLIIAGTALVALVIGGGLGFGTGLLASRVHEVRSTSAQFQGSGGMMGGGGSSTGKRGFDGGPGSGGRRSPSSPMTPDPTPNS